MVQQQRLQEQVTHRFQQHQRIQQIILDVVHLAIIIIIIHPQIQQEEEEEEAEVQMEEI